MPTLKDLAARIRQELDIADLVGGHVQLRRRGSKLIGLCPFHREKTPSFTVDPERGLYHCFGCKAGGDAIRFVEQIEGVDFKGALELMARRLGIAFEQYRGISREQAEEGKRREDTLREACTLARDFFRRSLGSPETGEHPRTYLDERAIAPDLIERFELGWSLEGWEALLGVLRAKGFRDQTAEEAGLAIRHPERGSHYDRFRGRLMFPIWDALGRPVAFGGRTLRDEPDSPKYINSPETPIYTKGEILYAYHLAKDSIRERRQAVLCEGYVDVIAAHGAGITEAVASLGTALTEAQAKMLRRHAERVVFLYDADAAGQTATLRGCEILIRQGLHVFIAPLESGLDPDDMVRRFGSEALRQRVAEARPALAHLTEYLLSAAEGPAEPLERRIWALEQLAPCLLANSNEISRDSEIRQLAQWVGIAEDLVRKHLAKTGPRAAQDLRLEAQQRKLDRPPAAEQALLRSLLEKPDLASALRGRSEVLVWITDLRVRRWLEWLLAEGDLPESSGHFALSAADRLADGSPEDEVLLREILLAEEDYSDPERVLLYTLERLERDAHRRKLAGLAPAQAPLQDEEMFKRVAPQIFDLSRKIHGLPRTDWRPPRS
jgi:DNA primase